MSSAVGIPSPRPSPAMRPQSPLSPRYDSNSRYDGSPQTCFRRTASNQSSAAAGQRRANAPSMRLPALPRFHPANYPSSHSGSAKTTPDFFDADASARTSPRSHQRGVSDSHKQRLAYYQHELLSGTGLRTSSPAGPHLMPAGSPGPVTPLELEADGGYLVAGARGNHDASGRPVAADELVERLIRQESGQRGQQHRRSSELQQSRDR